MLSEWLGAYPGGGDTKRKIESFFINALKHVDTPIAPALRKMSRNRPAQSASGATRRSPAITQPKGVANGAGKRGKPIVEEIPKPTQAIAADRSASRPLVALPGQTREPHYLAKSLKHATGGDQ